jgi:hypothetical protein
MRMLGCLLLVTIALSGDVVYRESASAGMRLKSIGLTPGSFGEANVERLARRELAVGPPDQFVKIDIFGKGGPPLPIPPEVSYDSWRRIYDMAKLTSNEVAEVISVRGNAVLRMRDATGALTRKVLAGRDPLQVEVLGQHVELVYLDFSNGFQSDTPRFVGAYALTSGPLTEQVGLGLLGQLDRLLPGLRVAVLIRNDTWFISSAGYPFYNPFVKDGVPPSEMEYNQTKTLFCGHLTGTPSCQYR